LFSETGEKSAKIRGKGRPNEGKEKGFRGTGKMKRKWNDRRQVSSERKGGLWLDSVILQRAPDLRTVHSVSISGGGGGEVAIHRGKERIPLRLTGKKVQMFLASPGLILS